MSPGFDSVTVPLTIVIRIGRSNRSMRTVLRARKAAAGKNRSFNGRCNLSRRQNTGLECVLSAPLDYPAASAPPSEQDLARSKPEESLNAEIRVTGVYFRTGRTNSRVSAISASKLLPRNSIYGNLLASIAPMMHRSIVRISRSHRSSTEPFHVSRPRVLFAFEKLVAHELKSHREILHAHRFHATAAPLRGCNVISGC